LLELSAFDEEADHDVDTSAQLRAERDVIGQSDQLSTEALGLIEYGDGETRFDTELPSERRTRVPGHSGRTSREALVFRRPVNLGQRVPGMEVDQSRGNLV
jgi:hypothetical protein